MAIAERFRMLRDGRSGRPVYGLEHGLAPTALSDLFAMVGNEIRRHSISGRWDTFYLPLIATASEIGYDYRGTGTDFWPKFESKLGVFIDEPGRQQVLRLFKLGQRAFGLKQPVASPWANAFNRIAWPIANAVAPKEIHRPLAIALREIYRISGSTNSEEAIVGSLRSVARKGWSSRLEDWLGDEELAAAVVLRLLELPDPFDRLSPDTLDRILADLASDREAFSAVRKSVELQQERLKAQRSRIAPIGTSILLLEYFSDRPCKLLLRMPVLTTDRRQRLRGILARSGVHASLFNGSIPVEADSLTSGLPIELPLESLHAISSDDTAFLSIPGDNAPDSRFLTEIEQSRPAVTLPIVFRRPIYGLYFEQVKKAIPATGALIVLTDNPPPAELRVQELAAVSGLRCFKVDASSSGVAAWLGSTDFNPADQPEVELLGGYPLGSGLRGPVFAAGFPIILKPVVSSEDSEDFTISVADEEPAILRTTDSIAIVEAIVGDHQISFERNGRKTVIQFTVVPAEYPGSALAVEIEPQSPSADDLLRGQIALRVSTPLPIFKVQLRASVVVSGVTIAESLEQVPTLPTMIGASSALLSDLTSQLSTKKVPRNIDLELKVEVGDFWTDQWQLGWLPKACEWDNSDGSWRAYMDEKQVDTQVFEASSPLTARTSERDQAIDDYRLLVPTLDDINYPAAAFCIGPNRISLRSVSPSFPERLLRQPSSKGEAIGLVPCAEAYIGWTLADTANVFSKRIAISIGADVELRLVEQLCGNTWTTLERNARFLRGSPWAGLASVALERKLASGETLPVVEAEDFEHLASLLESAMRKVIPDFPATGSEPISSSLAELLDLAVIECYELLSRFRLSQNKSGYVDVDTVRAPELWTACVSEAKRRYYGEPMVRAFLPTGRANRLKAPDYSQLTMEHALELLEDSHVDIRGSGRWLKEEDLRRTFQLWCDPATLARNTNWREVLIRMAADRQTARAIRYAALRFRASRGMSP